MTTTGFRLFDVELKTGQRGRKTLPWTADTHDELDHLRVAAHALEGERLNPTMSYAAIHATQPDQTTLASHVAVFVTCTTRGRHIFFEFDYGAVDSHPRARGATAGDDTDLQGKAPVRRYRADLIIPDAPDTKGLLAVQTHGRTCPRNAILKGIALTSRRITVGDAWRRLQPEQITDRDFVTDLLSQSKTAKIELKHTATTPSGKRRTREYTFTAPLTGRWHGPLSTFLDGKRRDPNDLFTLAFKGSRGDLDFNDGDIRLDNHTIHLQHLDELFTYPLTDPARWDQEVSDVARRLRPDLGW